MSEHTIRPNELPTMRSWTEPDKRFTAGMRSDVSVDFGWGRLVFGHTFADPHRMLDVMEDEEAGRRDICMYLRNPHVVVAEAPHELFIDPSYTYRLWFHRYRSAGRPARGVRVRALSSPADAAETNRIYNACGMLTAPVERIWENQRTRTFIYLVAEEVGSGRLVGTVTGVDHARAFDDPERGSSLWCLAVDPASTVPGAGEALVRTLAERFIARGRSYVDLSVMATNEPAIKLYDKLDFERVPVFAVKRKNPINEPLFAAPQPALEDLNPYARIVADEARRRGIAVHVLDAEGGFLQLSFGGRKVVTRESLSELTTGVAVSMCDDKRVTRRILQRAGLRVPPGRTASLDAEDATFLKEHEEVVVKPARGEQGHAVTVGVRDEEALGEAIGRARAHCPEVLIEACMRGQDLRIVVIDHRVVAAAIRKPASVTGTGHDSIQALIDAKSRRRAAATGGESRIPMDEVTLKTLNDAGFEPGDVLEAGHELEVRRTANLHTGGTIHDVTHSLHPTLVEVATRASRALNIPVVGLDLMVESPDREDHVFIEANERPGLANHEPQPTAQRFIDLLFPSTSEIPGAWQPPGARTSA